MIKYLNSLTLIIGSLLFGSMTSFGMNKVKPEIPLQKPALCIDAAHKDATAHRPLMFLPLTLPRISLDMETDPLTKSKPLYNITHKATSKSCLKQTGIPTDKKQRSVTWSHDTNELDGAPARATTFKKHLTYVIAQVEHNKNARIAKMSYHEKGLALFNAAHSGRAKQVKRLLAHGARHNYKLLPASHSTPLEKALSVRFSTTIHEALKTAQLSVIQTFLDHDGSIDLGTIMSHATKNNDKVLIQLLKERYNALMDAIIINQNLLKPNLNQQTASEENKNDPQSATEKQALDLQTTKQEQTIASKMAEKELDKTQKCTKESAKKQRNGFSPD